MEDLIEPNDAFRTICVREPCVAVWQSIRGYKNTLLYVWENPHLRMWEVCLNVWDTNVRSPLIWLSLECQMQLVCAIIFVLGHTPLAPILTEYHWVKVREGPPYAKFSAKESPTSKPMMEHLEYTGAIRLVRDRSVLGACLTELLA
jgi:hypothetical protein